MQDHLVLRPLLRRLELLGEADDHAGELVGRVRCHLFDDDALAVGKLEPVADIGGAGERDRIGRPGILGCDDDAVGQQGGPTLARSIAARRLKNIGS